MRFAALLFSVTALSLHAQDKKEPPKDVPKAFFPTPLIVAPGTKAKVTIRGQKLDSVTDAKLDAEKIPFKLLGKGRKSAPPNNIPPDKFGDSEVDIELDVPKDFPPGVVEVTLVGPDGPGSPLKLTIDQRGTGEKEPNNGFDQAQELTVPATVDGTIHRGQDVDVFKFAGKAGEKFRLAVRAATLGSPADLALTLYDADRRVLDSCDDFEGSPDPVLTVTLPRDGVYYLSVMESHDLGGVQYGYRLNFTK
jgi:hypothetical protein